jgi:hypothetical protein
VLRSNDHHDRNARIAEKFGIPYIRSNRLFDSLLLFLENLLRADSFKKPFLLEEEDIFADSL